MAETENPSADLFPNTEDFQEIITTIASGQEDPWGQDRTTGRKTPLHLCFSVFIYILFYGVHVEVREHLYGVASPFPPLCGLWD